MFDEGNLGEINFVDDEVEVVKCLDYLCKTKEKLWLWQEKEEEKRKIHFGIIKRVVAEKKVIMLFSGQSGVHFGFDRRTPVYVYSREQRAAFQTEYKNVENEFINLEIPPKIGVLNKEQCEKLAVIEVEDESVHKHKRVHERKQPRIIKFVRVEKIDSEKDYAETGTYDLYDMSQGGISFHVKDPSLFQTGNRVKFLEIGGETLDKELRGTVMSVRWIKQEEDDTILKVGVKFD